MGIRMKYLEILPNRFVREDRIYGWGINTSPEGDSYQVAIVCDFGPNVDPVMASQTFDNMDAAKLELERITRDVRSDGMTVTTVPRTMTVVD